MAEEKKKMSTGKKVLIGIGVYFVVGIIAVAVISQTDSFKNAEAETAKSADSAPHEENKIAWHKAGMYKVGKDISATEYMIYPLGAAAYYQVSTDSSGGLDSIVSNEVLYGCAVYVTVKNGQYLTVRDAQFTESEELYMTPANPIKQSMYRVGRDIPAGEYKVTSGGMTSYYAVQRDSYNTLESIITNEAMFEGTQYVTVRDGQYLMLRNCSAVLVE